MAPSTSSTDDDVLGKENFCGEKGRVGGNISQGGEGAPPLLFRTGQ